MLSSLAAMIVTAFDLGADPYFVYTLKAWIMAKTGYAWFGETVQGFRLGVCGFCDRLRLSHVSAPAPPATRQPLPAAPRDGAAGHLRSGHGVLQIILGKPVEIRPSPLSPWESAVRAGGLPPLARSA